MYFKRANKNKWYKHLTTKLIKFVTKFQETLMKELRNMKG